MGRPRIGYSRRINIEPDVIDALRLIASAQGVPVSAVIRQALDEFVQRTVRRAS